MEKEPEPTVLSFIAHISQYSSTHPSQPPKHFCRWSCLILEPTSCAERVVLPCWTRACVTGAPGRVMDEVETLGCESL